MAALAGAVLMAWLGLVGFAWNDYDTEAAPAVAALLDGDVLGFVERAPAYGGALILRAPFAVAAGLLGGGELAAYRAMALPCLLAAALLGLVLVGRLRARGVSRRDRAIVLGLCVANPVTLRALEIGHPEELLAAALAVGAVLAAGGRRDLLAAALLGLAIATKLWAVLAVGPVLLALPAHRMRALVVAGAISAAVLAPLVLVGTPDTLVRGAGSTGTIFQPWQLFWWLGDLGTPVYGADGQLKPDHRTPPAWLSPLTHPGIALLGIPLSLWWWRAHRGAGAVPERVLLLLALLLLLRCVLDPWNNVYYHLPFLLALLGWEALCRSERPPVLTLLGTVLVWTTFQEIPGRVGPDAQSLLYLAWALPFCGWLAAEAFAPGRRAVATTPRPARLPGRSCGTRSRRSAAWRVGTR